MIIILDTLVTNLTGSPLKLKDGTLLGSLEKVNDELLLEEAPKVVAGLPECDTVTTLDFSEKLASLVVSRDYTLAKCRLLELLKIQDCGCHSWKEPMDHTYCLTQHCT